MGISDILPLYNESRHIIPLFLNFAYITVCINVILSIFANQLTYSVKLFLVGEHLELLIVRRDFGGLLVFFSFIYLNLIFLFQVFLVVWDLSVLIRE